MKKAVKLGTNLQWVCPDCKNSNEEGEYRCYGCGKEVIVLDQDGHPILREED